MKAAIRETLDEILERPNPARRHRAYPRVAKRGISRAHKKRAHHRGVRHDYPPEIKIIEPAA